MSKISASKKLILDDFPTEVRKWLTKLIEPLNSFQEKVYAALTNGITVADNLKSLKSTQVLDAGQTLIKIKYTLNEKPSFVAVEVSSQDGSPVPPWSKVIKEENGTLFVTFNGLSGSVKYNVTIVAIV